MHPVRKQRLLLIIFVLVGLSCAVMLVLYALRQNINLYFTPAQINLGLAPKNHNFRLGGLVVPNSIVHQKGTLAVTFALTDKKHSIAVAYQGVLPDLFGDNQGVVAEGKLNAQGVFIATQVLAKHGAKYMPAEVLASLKDVNREKNDP